MFPTGFQIYEDINMVDTYTKTIVFSGHPITKWLAKYIDFNPDIEVTYTYIKPKKEVYKVNNILYAHPAIVSELKSIVTTITA